MNEALKSVLRPVRNAYYRLWPKARYPLTRQKDVLLYVNNGAMTSHIWRYYEPLKDDPRYRFFLYDLTWTDAPDPKDEFHCRVRESGITLCPAPEKHAWDLIVCADLRTPASFTRDMAPLLYVNHGLHIISIDGGETLYCYGAYARGADGRPKFTKMCESNALIAEAMKTEDPEMSETIVHTGFKFAAGIEAAVQRREDTRRLLGVKPDTCLVGFFGTWREHSLFHVLGDELFGACEELLGDGYQFLFSIHPNEYARYDPALEPLGPVVERQRERGMLVRSPQEDFRPYLAACDIVVSDYSSMAESAVLAGRKLIFSPYPDGMVWKHSLTAQARRVLPTLDSPEGLRFLLSETRRAPVDPFILRAREQLIRPDHDQILAQLTEELTGLKGGDAR